MSNDEDWRERDCDPEVLIIQTIIGHPEQLPTFAELDYFTPSFRSETVRTQLGHLIDKGAVARVEGDDETFYGLTSEYREELEYGGYFKAERTIQEVTLLTERTPEIDEKMQLGRPDWGPANQFEGPVGLPDSLRGDNDE